MDDMLAQASAHPSEVNLRICNNLIHTFAQERDYPKLLSATRLALAIKPNNKALLMKAAKVEAVLDNYGEMHPLLSCLSLSLSVLGPVPSSEDQNT